MRFTAMANIFLLEDDKILSKGISIALKKDEHTVTAVYGYLEALQQYQKQKYDLFLLDINLPDGNGLEFCKKIRETSETPVLFIIYLRRGRRISPRQTGSQSLEVLHGNMYPLSENGICIYLM